ncbi:molybdopterin-dependent oxidoreductase [bacterium]|nr:molybdopterin-dependent oxidoreductase [bacterium]
MSPVKSPARPKKPARPVKSRNSAAGFKVVNHNVEKVDGICLATGVAQFVDDRKFPGLLFIKFLYSPHAHARITKIDTTHAEQLKGVRCILHYGNVPRVLHTTAGQGYPEPSPYDAAMFDSKVRYVGDRVAAVAAETSDIAEEACRLIKVEYDVLPAVFDPEEAIKAGAPVIHDEPDLRGAHDAKRNMAAHVGIEVGSVEKGLAKADHRFEDRYELGYAQHCPIEPHVCITYLDDRDRLVIRTSTQVPFHARRICAQVLQIPEGQIRVIKPRIGGGFGAKQEVFLEYVAGLVTLRTRRPAKIEQTRAEEFYASRTRHPHIVNMRIGVKKNGMIETLDMKALSNTGAYGTHSLTVVCNCGSKALPLYNKAKNVGFIGEAAYTNLPVGGAYRGYGGTQGFYALESMMDDIAEKLGMDPLALRRKNHIRLGESSPVFAALGEGKEGYDQAMASCKLSECIDIGEKEINWAVERKNHGRGPVKTGVGCAILMQGSGIPGIDMGGATVKLNEDGSFNLLVGATDLGTGSDTVLAQIAAEALAVPVGKILIYSSDTDFTPFDVGAYASSTTYISGGAVKKAAENVRRQILSVAAEILSEKADNLACSDGHVVSKKTKKKISYRNISLRSLYSRNQFQIEATESHVSYVSPPPFAAHFAKVAVDTETGLVKLLKYVMTVDCGVAIHPKLAEGQAEGAAMNGISYALTEEFIFNARGAMVNASFLDYKLFSTRDLPEMKTILVPSYEPNGPFGAKSIAEININGPAPAIGNAIKNACGVRLRSIPYTPEKVLKAIRRQSAPAAA